MKVAEMEAKNNTRKSAPPKGYYYCKHCGRTISTKESLCQACREFEAMIDNGKDRTCKHGHAAKVGQRCEVCRTLKVKKQSAHRKDLRAKYAAGN